jgi:glycosyltransferase involved in cell wall biosynthesis
MPTKLRVCLLATEMCSHGGIQTFMWRITEVIGAMVKEGLAQGYVLSLNDNTVELRGHPAMPQGIQAWGASRSKARLAAWALGRMQPMDVMVVGLIGPAPLAYLLRKLGRVERYFVILHGIEAWKRVSALKRMAARSAVGVLATTPYTAAEFARQNEIGDDLLRVVPLCADERHIIPSTTFRLHGGFKLLCVARLDASERYKGFEHVFRALARLGSEHTDVHFNLVGDGADRLRLERTARQLGVSEQITFWGRLSDEDLAAAYADCDVFVMPSKKEGFGIVFLEAMRHGKPCIGGNHGGTPEVIDHGKSGFLVKYGDVDALANDIARLRRDPALRATLGARGRELVKTRFSARQFRERYQKLILDGAA